MTDPEVRTDVAVHIEAEVTEPAELVFSVAVAEGPERNDERLIVTVDGAPCPVEEVPAPAGGRLHVAQAPAGSLRLDYRATAIGGTDPAPVSAEELIAFRRPSRYAESDKLAVLAAKQFESTEGWDRVDAIVDWIHDNLLYVSGSSGPTDGAVDTYLAQQGVCRDFAHLTIAMLRACGFPARLVSVYAPGLTPMDFHAVVEVGIDGGWYVLDATHLAPRAAMVRIATGRDASDTAFLTVQSGTVQFGGLDVTAYRHGDLPVDSPSDRVQL